jgi:hypothetical protein
MPEGRLIPGDPFLTRCILAACVHNEEDEDSVILPECLNRESENPFDFHANPIRLDLRVQHHGQQASSRMHPAPGSGWAHCVSSSILLRWD